MVVEQRVELALHSVALGYKAKCGLRKGEHWFVRVGEHTISKQVDDCCSALSVTLVFIGAVYQEWVMEGDFPLLQLNRYLGELLKLRLIQHILNRIHVPSKAYCRVISSVCRHELHIPVIGSKGHLWLSGT